MEQQIPEKFVPLNQKSAKRNSVIWYDYCSYCYTVSNLHNFLKSKTAASWVVRINYSTYLNDRVQLCTCHREWGYKLSPMSTIKPGSSGIRTKRFTNLSIYIQYTVSSLHKADYCRNFSNQCSKVYLHVFKYKNFYWS